MTIASGQWGEATAWAAGAVVTVTVSWTSPGDAWHGDKIGTLPVPMRPPRHVYALFSRDNISQAYGDISLDIAPDGGVNISARGGAQHQGDAINASATFVAV